MKPVFFMVMVLFSAPLARAAEVVHGRFVAVSPHAGTPGVVGAALLAGRSTKTLGTMGLSWAGAALGGTGGKEGYGYALFDAGFIGVLGGRAGLGFYRDREGGSGIQAEAAVGIMIGLAYTRLRADAATKNRHLELGVMTVLPIVER